MRPSPQRSNQNWDLFGGLSATLRQAPHLAGDHRKSAALLTRSGCFYCGVQSQNIGLKGNAVSYANDLGYLATVGVDLFHCEDHLGDDLVLFLRKTQTGTSSS
jgi:hypothetical protein